MLVDIKASTEPCRRQVTCLSLSLWGVCMVSVSNCVYLCLGVRVANSRARNCYPVLATHPPVRGHIPRVVVRHPK